MSRPPPDHRALFALRDLGEAADLFRQVLADRLGWTGSDLAVLSLLESRGPLTAGQLAEATGLTTGAVTGLVDRLEGAGVITRRADADDRRRVILTLRPERLGPLLELHEPFHRAFGAFDAAYTDAQRALVAEYVQGSAEVFRQAALGLRSEVASAARAPGRDDGRAVDVRLDGLTRGRLQFTSGAARVTLGGGAPAGLLLAARFDGKPPKVTVRGDTVAVAYRGFGAFGWKKNGATLALAASVPWDLELRGGVARLEADLGELRVASIEVQGGGHAVEIALPRPVGTVPVRFTGGASDISLRRPPGTAARLRITGGAAALQFDTQRLGAVGGTVLLESPGWAAARDRYELEITGGAAGVTVVER